MAAVVLLQSMLNGSDGGAGLEQRDVFRAAPAAPSDGRPHALVPHIQRDLDEVARGRPHVLELSAFADESAHERLMVRVPDEVGVPIESVRPRR